METTEKIVESYCRYVKGWFTIPNIKCKGQYEIDLLAVDASSPTQLRRYHVECGVSISGAFSKLTGNKFLLPKLKTRSAQASQRRSLGFFIQRKFNLNEVLSKLREYGFRRGKYEKVIVTWGWTPQAKQQADRGGIILWDFRDILEKIAKDCGGKRSYFKDDTLRTIQLLLKSGFEFPREEDTD